jgi:hypothetical protein
MSNMNISAERMAQMPFDVHARIWYCIPFARAGRIQPHRRVRWPMALKESCAAELRLAGQAGAAVAT